MLLVALMVVAGWPALLLSMPQQYRYSQLDQQESVRKPFIYNPQLATFGKNPFFRTEFEPTQQFQSRTSNLHASQVPISSRTTFKNPHVSYEIARLSQGDRDDLSKIPIVANPASLLPAQGYLFSLENRRTPQLQQQQYQIGPLDSTLQQQTKLTETQSVDELASSGSVVSAVDQNQVSLTPDIPIRQSVPASQTGPTSGSSSSSGTISQGISDLTSSITDQISSISQGLASAVSPLTDNVQAISSSVAQEVQQAVSSISSPAEVASSVSESISSAVSPIADDVEALSSSVTKQVQQAVSSISSPQEIVSSISEGVSSIVSPISDNVQAISSSVTKEVQEAVSSISSPQEIVSSVSEGISSVVSPVADNVQAISSSVAQDVQAAVSSISSPSSEDVASSISQDVASVISPITDNAQAISSSVAQDVQAAVSSISSTSPEEVASSISEGVASAVSPITGNVQAISSSGVQETEETDSSVSSANPDLVSAVSERLNSISLSISQGIQDSIASVSQQQQQPSGFQPIPQSEIEAAIDHVTRNNVGASTGGSGGLQILPAAIQPISSGNTPSTDGAIGGTNQPIIFVPDTVSKPTGTDTIREEQLPAAIAPSYPESLPAAIIPISPGSLPVAIQPSYPESVPSGKPQNIQNIPGKANMPPTIYPSAPGTQIKQVSQPSVIPQPIEIVQQPIADPGSIESESSIEVSTGNQEGSSVEVQSETLLGDVSPIRYEGGEANENDDFLEDDTIDLFSLGRRRRPVSVIENTDLKTDARYSYTEDSGDTLSFVVSKRDVDTLSEAESSLDSNSPVSASESVTGASNAETSSSSVDETSAVPEASASSDVVEEDKTESSAPSPDAVEEGKPESGTPSTDVGEEGEPESGTPTTDIFEEGKPESGTPITDIFEEGKPEIVTPMTEDELLAAVARDPWVQYTKANFINSWNSEAYRRGLYFMSISDVSPVSGYVYMPDLEAYTRYIQGTPTVQYYTSEMLTAWTNTRQKIQSGIESPTEASALIEAEGQDSKPETIVESASLTEAAPLTSPLISYRQYLEFLASQHPSAYPQMVAGSPIPFSPVAGITQQQQLSEIQQAPFYLRNTYPWGVSSNIVNTGIHAIPGKAPPSSFPKPPITIGRPSNSHSSHKSSSRP